MATRGALSSFKGGDSVVSTELERSPWLICQSFSLKSVTSGDLPPDMVDITDGVPGLD